MPPIADEHPPTGACICPRPGPTTVNGAAGPASLTRSASRRRWPWPRRWSAAPSRTTFRSGGNPDAAYEVQQKPALGAEEGGRLPRHGHHPARHRGHLLGDRPSRPRPLPRPAAPERETPLLRHRCSRPTELRLDTGRSSALHGPNAATGDSPTAALPAPQDISSTSPTAPPRTPSTS